MNFEIYKNSLKDYLRNKGFDPSNNPMMCFSHPNNNTPSMIISDNHFKCMNAGCQASRGGDIFDAAGILINSDNKKEQIAEVQSVLGKNYSFEQKPEKKKEPFVIDQQALNKLIDYLRKLPDRKNGVAEFLRIRGYTEEIIEKMSQMMTYWPGYDKAVEDIGLEILKKAGVPGRHPKTGISSWNNSGAIVRLNQGLKLCFYENDKCQKRGTKGCFTFPGPYQFNKNDKIILVEAEITAISLKSIGFENVIPTGGTEGLIDACFVMLNEASEILIAFDGDEAGRKGTEKIIEKLKNIEYSGKIKVANLPENKDPDDLIRQNRIDELKAIIDLAKTIDPPKKEKINEKIIDDKNRPFAFMGYDPKAHYVLPKNQNVPIRIARGDTTIKNWIKEFAAGDWWFNNFNCEKEDKDGNVKTVFDLPVAMEWFRQESFRRGIYNEDNLLGLGAHKDNNEVIFNTGNGLLVKGKKVNYEDYNGENIYCRSNVVLKMEGEKWTKENGSNFFKQLKTFNFERTIDYIAVCGYTVLAPFASILKIRPHIWITAKKGTGKTTLIRDLIVPVVGKKQSVYIEGMTSEAYIRQKTNKDCRIPINDEFEAHSQDEMREQKKILKLSRSAYAGAVAGKGTPDHKPIEFNLKMMFCFASINVYFDNDGDRRRIAVCRMKEKKDNNYMKAIENEDGLRLRIFSKIKNVRSYIDKAKAIMLENGHGGATADTYSPFLVGFWMLLSDKDFWDGEENMKKHILESIKNISEPDFKDDEHVIMERILQERIKYDIGKELSIAEMLTTEFMSDGRNKLTHDDLLQRYGLRRYNLQGEEVLALEMNHPDIEKILKDTSFQKYTEILKRHDDVIKDSQTVWIAKRNTRCIIFSWEKLLTRYFQVNKEGEPF